MIKTIEKDYLNDSFIYKSLINNIKLNEKINFNKNDIYYFGNYNEDKLELIKKKLLKNKKSLIKAINNNVKFIICASSIKLFNNNFKQNELNIFTCYENNNIFNKHKILKINDLKKGINSLNFKYKNLICIKDEKMISKLLFN